MARVVLTEVVNSGNDRLQVKGTVDGLEFTGHGWISAMTNHFPASAYNPDGNRKPGSTPRAMTRAEKRNYCEALLLQQVASQNTPVSDIDLG